MTKPLDYLGVKPCGCAVAWCSGDQKPRDVAQSVGQMIRDGMDVVRVTTEESRRRLGVCTHVERPVKQEELAL